jgi:hypothetical protein
VAALAHEAAGLISAFHGRLRSVLAAGQPVSRKLNLFSEA